MKNNMLNSCVAIAAILCAGCADAPSNEHEFGSSVRNMIMHQTYNPEAGKDSYTEGPPTADGAKTEGVLQEYRKDVANPKDIVRDTQLNVGK